MNMSRIPQPSSSRTPSKLVPTSSTSSPRIRTQSTAASSSRPTPTPLKTQRSLKTLKSTSKSPVPPKPPAARRPSPAKEDTPDPSGPQLSIREQIALRRAEAKKAQTGRGAAGGFDLSGLEEALSVAPKKSSEDEVDLGRWSVKETIERARSSGALNLASRALPCLPSALFEIHLGVNPKPLDSTPEEPSISTSTADDISSGRRRGGQSNAPSWYEAQDLEVLKAWSNDIVEIQPEISMFGSLKIVDLHNNKLATLPDSFADLTALTILDVSHNSLTTLPINLFALPNLTTLNLSHNALTSLPFRAPFDAEGSNPLSRTKDTRGDWFSQSITRATTPLPRLSTLSVSHNHLTSSAIQHSGLPSQISKLDLSSNPLGTSAGLLRALARLDRLRELRAEQAEIANDSFPIDLLSSLALSVCFPMLRLLDLGETRVTRPAIESSFQKPSLRQELDFEVTNEDPPEGTLRVVLGKKVIKETWEIEAERRAKSRAARHGGAGAEEGLNIGWGVTPSCSVSKEACEIEAEQGLLTEGVKRRARATAAAQASTSSVISTPPVSPRKPKVVEKGQWEIEAELGLLTEGAKRRARAAAITASTGSTSSSEPPRHQASTPASSGTRSTPSPSPGIGSALSNPQFYDASAHTLTLPPSTPPAKAAHSRSISLAVSPRSNPKKGGAASGSDLTLAIPTPTLPLAAIVSQSLAQTLRVLNLVNRRKDPAFNLPVDDGPFLPSLEELSLEGCNLPDSITVSYTDNGDDFSSPRKTEPLLPLIARLFPSVRTLELSYNALNSVALTKDALASLILASPPEETSNVRKGLRHLRLRGNRLTELDGFRGIADMFKGNRDAPCWRLEELDVRDNEIGRLPPELGLLPLDVFLVDGNIFRVPQRRVWEREGTKGLLSWLRGRIE